MPFQEIDLNNLAIEPTKAGLKEIKLHNRDVRIKKLLAQNLSVQEVANKMGLSRQTIYGRIKHRGWEDFVRVDKRCNSNKTQTQPTENPHGLSDAQIQGYMDKYTAFYYGQMKQQKFRVEYSDVSGEVGLCIAKALTAYNPQRGAIFGTFLNSCMWKHFATYKNDLAMALRRQGYVDIGKKSGIA